MKLRVSLQTYRYTTARGGKMDRWMLGFADAVNHNGPRAAWFGRPVSRLDSGPT